MKKKMSISTSRDAAEEFKKTVIHLMTGLTPIVKRFDAGGGFNVGKILKSATSGSDLTQIFDNNLSPSMKFTFAQAWAQNMNSVTVMEMFNRDTKNYWDIIENGSPQAKEEAVLQIIKGLSIPSNGAAFLQSMYGKKDLLTVQEKAAVLNYFQNCVYYGRMYQELKAERL